MNYFYNSSSGGGCLGGCLLMLLMLIALPFLFIYKLISGKSVSVPNMKNREKSKDKKVEDEQFKSTGSSASEAIIDVEAKEVD